MGNYSTFFLKEFWIPFLNHAQQEIPVYFETLSNDLGNA